MPLASNQGSLREQSMVMMSPHHCRSPAAASRGRWQPHSSGEWRAIGALYGTSRPDAQRTYRVRGRSTAAKEGRGVVVGACMRGRGGPKYSCHQERGHQRSSEVIRGHQRSSEAIRGHQRPSVAVSGRQWPSEAVRGHQRSSEVIRGHQRSSEAIRGHQRSSEGPKYSCHMERKGQSRRSARRSERRTER